MKKTKRRFLSFLGKIVGGLFFLLLLSVAGIATLFIIFAKDLPRPEQFTDYDIKESTKIYDRTGQVLLYDIYGEERREIVSLDKISSKVKEALIATEDSNFYNHFGIEPRSIVRAILADLKLRSAAQGASTISQQLIRSSFLTTDKTASRKFKEIILTLELERKYSKDEILYFYLNQVPFGSNTYGIEAASQFFFGKTNTDVSLAEAALLVSLVQSPSYLSPYGYHQDRLFIRKDYVLDRMAEEGYISQEEADNAKEETLVFKEPTQIIKAPHFVLYVKDLLEQKYGEEYLMENGLKIYTSLNWDFQKIAEEAVEKNAKNNEVNNGYNASLVAVDPKTGEILAMVGSKDYFGESQPEGCTPGLDCLFEPSPNVAIRGRQPGSSFKPFVYVTAFNNGYDDQTIVIDEETNFGTSQYPYIPQNYDGRFRGPVTLRNALAQSLNIPAIKVLRDFAGISNSINTAKNFGITTLTKDASFYGLPLVLGGGDVKLLEITSAYGVFATSGLYTPTTAIIKITDNEGNLIESSKPNLKRVCSSYSANLISSILSDNEARAPVFGLNSKLYFSDYQVAAKTGTTQGYKDGWVIGYTPSISVGVWTGNNDNTPMSREPGVVMAGPIWRYFMDNILPLYPKTNFPEPVKPNE